MLPFSGRVIRIRIVLFSHLVEGSSAEFNGIVQQKEWNIEILSLLNCFKVHFFLVELILKLMEENMLLVFMLSLSNIYFECFCLEF